MGGEIKEFKEFREFREFREISLKSLISLISLIFLNIPNLLNFLIRSPSPTTQIYRQSGANLPPIKRKSGWDILSVFPIRSLD